MNYDERVDDTVGCELFRAMALLVEVDRYGRNHRFKKGKLAHVNMV